MGLPAARQTLRPPARVRRSLAVAESCNHLCQSGFSTKAPACKVHLGAVSGLTKNGLLCQEAAWKGGQEKNKVQHGQEWPGENRLPTELCPGRFQTS